MKSRDKWGFILIIFWVADMVIMAVAAGLLSRIIEPISAIWLALAISTILLVFPGWQIIKRAM
jgi:hypothetical protein